MNKLIVALALASAISAISQDTFEECEKAYSVCIEAGTPEVACSCTLTACAGEDSARIREYCSSATASLAAPTPTKIPGGCNPAHPGSCPSSYFNKNSTAPAKTITSAYGIPGGCNPAHPGSCPSSYFTKSGLPPTKTPIPVMPGDCSPASPRFCPAVPYIPASSHSASHPAPTGNSSFGGFYPSPKPLNGQTAIIKNLTRYCGEDNDGCDYNFVFEGGGKTEQCTIIRMPGSDAATESWSNEPCNDKSNLTVSWGYVTEPGPAFAVITVVKGKVLAWFGVADVNGQKVTPSNPFGSGEFGNLGPEQVYTY
ncbi:uncharacterized protein FTOL_08185 [Fusarium torulosum]|uniref:Extracellular membrane protein CFEM domain-containing protein n=1 Tax=Fusarium torulosum TaxID=33205 RepID=A0AAE8SJR0_9HYPO|nr:uncharacterized protein FTOL_08185 [Fusarium torulosum]